MCPYTEKGVEAKGRKWEWMKECRNSLYYFYNFPVSLKLFQNKKLKRTHLNEGTLCFAGREVVPLKNSLFLDPGGVSCVAIKDLWCYEAWPMIGAGVER